ncbi:hypothetical protein [Cryptosporangium japonicum]|uniref:Uncharacterized protein n=1 Tax=Cryptosporangium japonicum TaxID=80872 RepID=A0ABP3ELY2_9ACTN
MRYSLRIAAVAAIVAGSLGGNAPASAAAPVVRPAGWGINDFTDWLADREEAAREYMEARGQVLEEQFRRDPVGTCIVAGVATGVDPATATTFCASMGVGSDGFQP